MFCLEVFTFQFAETHGFLGRIRLAGVAFGQGADCRCCGKPVRACDKLAEEKRVR